MKKKVSMFAAVLTAGALLLAGCASSGGDAGKESKSASDSTTVEQMTEEATEESTEATTEEYNRDGDTWENPYFDDFRSLYEGKKLN